MPIENGDTVRVHYTGREKDGTVFDSSQGRDPLEFTMGSGQLIPGFEAALLGKEPGDKVTAVIAPEQGYGPVDKDLIFTVAKEQVPSEIPLAVGTPLTLSSDRGRLDVTITEVGSDEITLDANHPLAGKVLEFDIEILDIKKGSAK